jgi:hypothetical protein
LKISRQPKALWIHTFLSSATYVADNHFTEKKHTRIAFYRQFTLHYNIDSHIVLNLDTKSESSINILFPTIMTKQTSKNRLDTKWQKKTKQTKITKKRRVMLTSVPGALVKDTKKATFALIITLFIHYKHWVHNFQCDFTISSILN